MKKIKKQTHRHKESDLWLPSGREGERDGWGLWGQCMETTVFRMDKQQGPIIQHRG